MLRRLFAKTPSLPRNFKQFYWKDAEGKITGRPGRAILLGTFTRDNDNAQVVYHMDSWEGRHVNKNLIDKFVREVDFFVEQKKPTSPVKKVLYVESDVPIEIKDYARSKGVTFQPAEEKPNPWGPEAAYNLDFAEIKY